MNFFDVVQDRRSIRQYVADEDIPQTNVELMLEAAMLAPSACNTRPWSFYVISNRAVRMELAALHPYAAHRQQAPLGIVVCAQPEKQKGISAGFWPQDCGAAIENLLLEAVNLGYGACWCGIYPSLQGEKLEKIQQLLGTDEIPVALVTVGVPDEEPNRRGYYDPAAVHYIR